MANKQLTATVRLNTKQAETRIDALVKKINNINNNVNKINTTNTTTEKKVNGIIGKVQLWANKQKNILNTTKSTASSLGSVGTKLKGILGTYLTIATVKKGLAVSDTIASSRNRINAMNGYDTSATELALDKIYVAANNSRASYADMISNVSKSMTLAPDAFQGNIDNAIRFQEIMAKAYVVGGASQTEASTSMYQMIQALGAGVLQGDELRSVREGAPLAYKEIEKFAQGVLKTDESLKELAADGKITSQMVVAAVMDMGIAMDETFAKTDWTFAQAFDRVKNMAVQAFRPVSSILSQLLNKAINSGMLEDIEMIFTKISNMLQMTIMLIAKAIQWVVDNWNWLKWVIIAGLALIAAYFIYTKAVAIASAIATGVAWAIANWQILLVIVAIAAVLAFVIYFLDYVLAAIYTTGAIIWNIVAGLINMCIQAFWTMFVEPFATAMDWIVNLTNGSFDGMAGAFKNALGQMLSFFISFAKPFAKVWDTLFGTDATSAIESAQSSLKSWGLKKGATASNIASKVPQLDRIAYSDAWNTGIKHGTIAKDWMSGKGNSIANLGNSLGLNTSAVNFPSGSQYDVSDVYNPDLGNISDNTDTIADSMDLTQEDLSYLRKIAEKEWKKEYTTANITVEMNNNNNISGDSDLDGIVTKLSDKLYEELNIVANGVYA